MKAESPVALKYWLRASALLVLFLFAFPPADASNHYTAKQLEFLAERVGKTYWIDNANNRNVSFLTAPAAAAPTFNANPYESFEITELVGRKSRNPFYKIKLESGREGFIQPDQFLQELNVTIVSIDPQADQKRRDTAAADEEKKRLTWIQAQPWSQAVKEAAVKKRPVLGMTAAEITKVLGNPTRVSKVRGTQRLTGEHWFYPTGDVLVFQNGLLKEVRKREKSEE